MTTDYEAEYNNSTRVPEHPEIFARWARDGAAYRAETGKEGRAEIGLTYGPSARQTIDLFKPRGDADGPLAMFIHGGYWRSFDPSSFSQMARGMNGRGITVAVPGYDLCPHVTIAQIIEQMQAACLFLWRRFKRRVMVSGHSAGGHLAACMIATDWKRLDADAPADLVPTAYAISGLFDLAPLVQISRNADFKLDAAEARRVSPLFWPVPPGRMLDAVVGALESSEFLRQSRIIADGWGAKGVKTRYEAIAGMNHFTVCDAMMDADSAMTQRMTVLANIAASR
ncbi:MAG TPA: alpha/beta hydrolase [Xanthobacteraceae bacterium]|nr:alpha/beta hydrolase [Xanthobacteraceae bacterium]